MNREWNLSGLKVHIGIPAYTDLPPRTALSLCGTLLTLAKEGVQFGLSVKYGNCYVDQIRSIIAQEFLSGPADLLFHIDSDMVWEPSDFVQVLAHTTVMDSVSVAYRMKDEVERYTACIPETVEVNEYGCIPLDGGGLGFSCVQRKVMEELARRAEKVHMGQCRDVPWVYRCRAREGCYQGEDMAFFDDMRAAGFRPFLDAGLSLGHLGRKEYRGSLMDALLGVEKGGLLAWNYPADVQGWLGHDEALALARLANGKDVVEIGSYCGKSTIAMAQVAKKVDSIDWHQGDEMSGPGGTLPHLRANLASHGVAGRVTLHVGRTEEVAPRLDPCSFDMAFIDGAHDEPSVRLDIEQCLRLVRAGGVIALHDFGVPAVKRAAASLLGDSPAGQAGELVWYKRAA